MGRLMIKIEESLCISFYSLIITHELQLKDVMSYFIS
jgi:hypothetical protein